MSINETDRLFRKRPEYTQIAGTEFLEHLTGSGTLPPDFAMHIQSLPPEDRGESFTQAIRAAIGDDMSKMPSWAVQGHVLPDAIDVPYINHMREQLDVLEGLDVQYYSMLSLLSTLRGDSNDNLWRNRAFTVSRMSWKRILKQIDPLSKQRFDYIDSFPSQAAADSSGIDLKYAGLQWVKRMCIKDEALYEMIAHDATGLRKNMKGIGEIAIFGIGAMLFNDGHHPDMLPYAEKLEDYVEAHATSPS